MGRTSSCFPFVVLRPCGAPHAEQASVEVHVALFEREDLPLAEPRVDGRREDFATGQPRTAGMGATWGARKRGSSWGPRAWGPYAPRPDSVRGSGRSGWRP